MFKLISSICAVIMITANFAFASPKDPLPDRKGSAELELVKSLVGNWKGTHKMDSETTEDVEVHYSITSGGATVVEKLFPGTSHEMTTTYYDVNGKLEMTHYCALGNRPVMKLVDSNKHSVTLEHLGGDGIIEAAESHMHGLKLSSETPGTLTQAWIFYENGKPTKGTLIELKKI